MSHRVIHLIIFGITLTLAGCGGSDRTLHHVSGTVTFDGQPVPAGAIYFEPDATVGNDGTQGYAEIKNGRYDTAKSEKGITGGAYQVRVRGYVPPEGNNTAKVLFKDYREPIQLPAGDSEQNIAVPAEAAGDGAPVPEIT